MTLYFLLVVLILCFSMKVTKDFNTDYLDKSNTNVVKGFFLLLVFLSHISGYYKFNTSLDQHYFFVRSIMGQTVVVAFLFFSGYGVMESIARKSHYMSNFLTNRVLRLLVHFDIAVTLFLLTRWILGNHVSVKQYLLALTTWGGIGNSNWYITCILFCYLFSYICEKVTGKNLSRCAFIILMSSLCLNYMLILSKYRQWYWFDTILCYPLGMLFSIYKTEIIDCMSKKRNYVLALGGGISSLHRCICLI